MLDNKCQHLPILGKKLRSSNRAILTKKISLILKNQRATNLLDSGCFAATL
jgi:hypothetical protein